jgi:hypothetical protein
MVSIVALIQLVQLKLTTVPGTIHYDHLTMFSLLLPPLRLAHHQHLVYRISMNLQNKTGFYTIVSQIVAGSGNEEGSNNYTDSEKIDYFSNQD